MSGTGTRGASGTPPWGACDMGNSFAPFFPTAPIRAGRRGRRPLRGAVQVAGGQWPPLQLLVTSDSPRVSYCLMPDAHCLGPIVCCPLTSRLLYTIFPFRAMAKIAKKHLLFSQKLQRIYKTRAKSASASSSLFCSRSSASGWNSAQRLHLRRRFQARSSGNSKDR